MKRQVLMPIAGLLLAASAWAGQEKQVTLQWNELAPQILEKKVALVLPSGVSVQGRVRAVEPDRLLLDISKTSDKHIQPKGLQPIPRQSVSVLRITEYRRLGRLIATTAALGAGAALTAAAASDSGITEGVMVVALPAAGAAGTVGLGVAGYYFGKAIDKRVTIIRVAAGN